MEDGLMDHGYSVCVIITKEDILQSKKETRYTLHNIIQREIIAGSTIHSDG